MRLVARLESTEDRDGVLHARLAHHHRLEPAGERGVLLDVLPVLVERRRADAPELAPRQRGLQQVAGAHRAIGLPGADDGVQFVDEEDDRAFRGRDLPEDGLQSLLELASELRTGEELTDVERHDPRTPHAFGAVVIDDPDGEPFRDGGLADARFADQHGVVLGAARKHLHAATDLLVPTDHGIDLSGRGPFVQVDRVLLERLEVALRVGIVDLRHAGGLPDPVDRRVDRGPRRTATLEDLPGVAGHLHQPEQQVLGRDVGVLPFLRFTLGPLQDLHRGVRGSRLGAGRLRSSSQFRLGDVADPLGLQSRLRENRRCDAVPILDHRGEDVERREFAVAATGRERLGVGKNLLGEGGESVHLHV